MFYSSFSHHFFFQTVFVFIFPLPTPFYSSFSHHFFSQTVLVFIFLLPTPFLYFVLPSLLLSDTLCFHFPVTSLTDTFFYSCFYHHFFVQTVFVFIFPSLLSQTPFLFLFLPSLLLSDSLCFHFPFTNTCFILRSPITSSLKQSLFSFSRYQHLFYSSFSHHFFSQTLFVFIFPSLLSQTPFLFLFLPSLLLSDSLCFHFPFTNTFLFFVLPSLLLSDTLCFHFPVTSLTETFLILVSTITSSLR